MTEDQPLEIDDSAALFSATPEVTGSPLVLLLHGRGSHERDLFSLVPALPSDALYVSLRAPIAYDDGWSWFVSGAPAKPDPVSAIASTTAVLDWLDRVAPSGKVSVVGFSQGGAMATQLLRHAPERFASVVNLAGFSIDGGSDAEADARLTVLRKPVFWGRDPADPVIPAAAVERTREWLSAHAVLTVREYPGIGHAISREEIDDVAAFLRATLLR